VLWEEVGSSVTGAFVGLSVGSSVGVWSVLVADGFVLNLKDFDADLKSLFDEIAITVAFFELLDVS
jgi:hypothetical protein